MSIRNNSIVIKNILNTGFKFAIGIVLIGKILNWFFEFGDQTNFILNVLMFSLIGLAYIIYGIVWDNKFLKLIFLISGLYLIAINFMNKSTLLTLFGIICIIGPILIIRIFPQQNLYEDNH